MEGSWGYRCSNCILIQKCMFEEQLIFVWKKHYSTKSKLTVVSLSLWEYLSRFRSPSIWDFKFCSCGSFLRCFDSSFNSAKKLSRLRFSASTCFSSHRLALAFRSLVENYEKIVKRWKLYCLVYMTLKHLDLVKIALMVYSNNNIWRKSLCTWKSALQSERSLWIFLNNIIYII